MNMSKKLMRRALWPAAIAMPITLIAAVSALAGAYGSTISVKGPSGVTFGSTYNVKVTGQTASQKWIHTSKANTVAAFEGGNSAGKPIHCYSSFASEHRQYSQLELPQFAAHGGFRHTYGFTATHTGTKALCAYVINKNAPGGPSTFVHGSTTWTVS
jgi:hypothetical protein